MSQLAYLDSFRVHPLEMEQLREAEGWLAPLEKLEFFTTWMSSWVQSECHARAWGCSSCLMGVGSMVTCGHPRGRAPTPSKAIALCESGVIAQPTFSATGATASRGTEPLLGLEFELLLDLNWDALFGAEIWSFASQILGSVALHGIGTLVRTISIKFLRV